RLDATTLAQLDKLADATERSKAWLAAQAVKAYIALNEWQTGAIAAAVKRANRHDARFLSHDEVDAWLLSWGTAKERKPPL
ncbi:MAG TPA: hypothetical protein VMT58_06660, partial [Candidatus Binataceae bacterium]|nr:hypothetical protein [Candidatus Binataceae bacterium]